jgi:DNA helicase-2/ATP-dependent DNA helicase PcrA
MLRTIYEERGLTLRHKTFAKARDMFEIRKLIKQPDYYEDLITKPLDALRQKYMDAAETDDILFYGYLYQQKKCFGLDYNDLIKFVLHIFQINEEIRRKWQQSLEYIMVDEFQDIDELQYRLMKVLSECHKNLFIVGDPDQTIYTWRGASVRFLLDFDREFDKVKTILMMQNYRSSPQIVRVANSLIGTNKNRLKKDLLPTLPEHSPVTYHHAKTAEAEAKWIASRVFQLTCDGVKPGDIAVLYRAHYISRTLEEVFLKEQIPYTIYSGVQFFNRTEIKDALSYLRLIALKDDLSFLRVANVPKRNLGRRRMGFLQDYAAQNACSLLQALEQTIDDELFKNTKAKKLLALITHFSEDYHEKPISEVLSGLLDRSGYETALRTEGSQTRLDNLAELKQSVYEYETTGGEEGTLEPYLSHVSLMTGTDTVTGKNAVKLMTVHTAKGLEFPTVFLCGLAEGVFPSKKTATLEGMEEERRLAFVAVTRAENALFLSDAEGRNLDGSFRYPSRFIFNIDRSLLDYTDELDERLISESADFIASSEKAMEAQTSGSVYEQGDRIVHSILGAGTVLQVDIDILAYLIAFDDLPTPRKISFKVKLASEGAT